MTNERLSQLLKSGGIIKLAIRRDRFDLLAGGETSEITAEQAGVVFDALRDMAAARQQRRA